VDWCGVGVRAFEVVFVWGLGCVCVGFVVGEGFFFGFC